MARLARLVIPGHPHHVVQRGHNRQPVFADMEDRRSYLATLREAARVHAVAVYAYALLDTEIQLLVVPAEVESLSKMMQAVGRRYVGAFNQRHGRTGTLWEGRYRATVIEGGRYLLSCMRYIEGLAANSSQSTASDPYPWTSAPHHLGLIRDPLLTEPALYWSLGNTPFEREAAYNLLLQSPLDEAERLAIADALQKGWALGSPAFIDTLQQQSERRLRPLKRGRPAKRSTGQSVPNKLSSGRARKLKGS